MPNAMYNCRAVDGKRDLPAEIEYFDFPYFPTNKPVAKLLNTSPPSIQKYRYIN